jgi:hypothetical protein
MIKMSYPLTNNFSHEEDQEIVDILIDSDLYLDMELVERLRLCVTSRHVITIARPNESMHYSQNVIRYFLSTL